MVQSLILCTYVQDVRSSNDHLNQLEKIGYKNGSETRPSILLTIIISSCQFVLKGLATIR